MNNFKTIEKPKKNTIFRINNKIFYRKKGKVKIRFILKMSKKFKHCKAFNYMHEIKIFNFSKRSIIFYLDTFPVQYTLWSLPDIVDQNSPLFDPQNPSSSELSSNQSSFPRAGVVGKALLN